MYLCFAACKEEFTIYRRMSANILFSFLPLDSFYGMAHSMFWKLAVSINILDITISQIPSHVLMNSMKLVIPLQSLYWSIHTKDESKRGTAFAFIFGVN